MPHQTRNPAFETECVKPWMANEIWRVLIEECGCRDARDSHYSFTHYLAGKAGGFGHEYRFMGALGFGGKFYNDRFRWRVGCYPENRTPKRDAMIDQANKRLAKLRAEYIATAGLPGDPGSAPNADAPRQNDIDDNWFSQNHDSDKAWAERNGGQRERD